MTGLLSQNVKGEKKGKLEKVLFFMLRLHQLSQRMWHESTFLLRLVGQRNDIENRNEWFEACTLTASTFSVCR